MESGPWRWPEPSPIPRTRPGTASLDLPVGAVDEGALAARVAMVTAAAKPADRDAIADGELFDARTEFGYGSGNFVPEGEWPHHVRKATGGEGAVGAAYAA